MITLSVDLIEPVGSTLTLGQSGDTITVPSGATFTNSGAATGFGGIVLDVTQVTLDTTISTTSTSYVASGLTITITPDSSSSRFLLLLSGGEQGSATNNAEVHTTFYVGGSEVSPAGPYETMRQDNYHATVFGPHSAFCLHSPATASAVTYAVFYKASSGTANFNITASRVQFNVMALSS